MFELLDMLAFKKHLKGRWEKYYSKTQINFKIKNTTLYNQVKATSNTYPDNVAISYFKKDIKYKDLIKEIDKIAISFQELGVVKEDVITICMPNTPEVLICLYALNKIGAICNMLHPLSAEEEIYNSIKSTNTKIIIMYDDNHSKLIKSYDLLDKVIYISPSNKMDIFTKVAFKFINIKKKKYQREKFILNYQHLLKLSKNKKFKNKGLLDKNSKAVILHSGGTSGKPKNVVLQNRSFILGAKQTSEVLKLNDKDSTLGIMPNFHGFGLEVTMHTALTIGAKTILVPAFNSRKFDCLIKKTKPTIILGVPTLFEALLNNNNVKNLDLSNLKYLVSGGDILKSDLEDRINDYLKEHHSMAKITQGYGLSEALAAVSLGYGKINKKGSIGIPLPGNYIKIIDPATRLEVKPDEIGEIVIHTKGLMLEYLNDEIETNSALQVHRDNHVWLHTGDLGRMDKDGFIFYEGRIKRMIISSGYNIYPSHVEEVLEGHPDVLQATVVGKEHPYKKEVPIAYIVLKNRKNLFIKQELKEYCVKRLEYHMIPVKFIIRKNLPKTKLGKIDYLKLLLNGEEDD